MMLRWKAWVAGSLGVLATYAALGFWGVPALLPKLLADQAQAVGRQASIAAVRFNPFTLRLEATDIRLREREGADLLALGGLVVEAQWRSIVRRAWSFSEVRLVRPQAWARIEAQGGFNLAKLAADLQGPAPSEPSPGLPRVVVELLAVDEGQVDFDDRRAGYSNVVTPVTFRLDNFSTLPEHNDDHVLSARSARGGVLRWKGTASLQPLRGNGELSIENAGLPELAVYLKPWVRATVAAGRLDAVVPYTFAYADGKPPQARLAAARATLTDLAVAHEGAKDSFATLSRLEVGGVDVDLVGLKAEVAQVKVAGGRLAVRRDARGALDLDKLVAQAAGSPASAPVAQAKAPAAWQVALREVALEGLAVRAVDETAKPAARLDVADVSLRLAVDAAQNASGLDVRVSGGRLDVSRVALASAGRTPLKLGRFSVEGAELDLARRQATVAKVLLDGAELEARRDDKGEIDLLGLLPRGGAPSAAASPGAAWSAKVGTIALQRSRVRVADQASGIEMQAQDIAVQFTGAGSDLSRPVKFQAGLQLAAGGRIGASGSIVPATTALQADLDVRGIALAPLQPLLSQYVRLRLATGAVSARGRLVGNQAGGKKGAPQWQYDGGLHVSGLTLNEEDGEVFAAWKDVGTDRLRATVAPNRLEIPELRVDGAQAKLIIENDRSLNAARLLVPRPAAVPVAAAPAPTEDEPFPVRIRRVRLSDAKLDFTDLSLRPQFSAKIYELGGAVNGLSTQKDTRSQLELDGRVDEFGSARLRGEINAFSPRDSTDLLAVFRNVDMVPASPYSMKFAGYRIAEGKISLDLEYKVKAGQLEGNNKIVIDRLTLGERVDSPDALKIPLQLAIAILKDSDGRIDLGLPVSGSLDDPQFSYGAIVWKAIGNVLGKIVTAPFRALGAMLGVSGDKLESIDFDPGSAKLLPPEREKIRQVAQILGKRAQLKLAVPGGFNEAADGAALRQRALRAEVARRAGIPLAEGEEPGPMDTGDRAVRVALQELFAQRFGKAELDKQMEAAAGEGATRLPAWQRVGKFIQGEPQVADAAGFYARLQQRLEQAQPLEAGVLQRLGEQRAAAILAALAVSAERAGAGKAEAVDASARVIPLKLELSAR